MANGLIIRTLVFLAWMVCGPMAWAQACPPMPTAQMSFQTDMVSPVYRNDRNRAVVTQLAGHSGNPNLRQHGLTRSETDFQLAITLAIADLGNNRLCVALKDVKGTWLLSLLEVDVVSELAPGTCPHGVVRAHENQHVALTKQVFTRHMAPMRARFAEVVRGIKPQLIRGSAAQASRQFQSHILTEMKIALAAYNRDVAAANAVIDTPENYRSETAKCPVWK